jgi:hypothetical protein
MECEMGLNLEQCPLCGTELSGVKFKEIQAKLRREEQDKAAKLTQAESAIRLRLERQFSQDLEKQRQSLEKKAKAEAADQINKLVLERNQAAAKAKEAEAREVNVRKQMAEDAERERLKVLANQRQTLETDKKLALLKQQSEFNRERESFQKKMQLLEKQLEKKTANELGDGAEIDLYETLRENFPTDKISRIQKGQAGADILHEVLYKGTFCGRIIIESKNRQDWKSQYVTKLRQDQVEAEAEHAILATTFFPQGKKEMYIESGIIVVAPARVVYIVQLLRNAMVTMHVKGLSMKERSTKMSRLYKLITSESYARKFVEANKLAEEILDLDVQEKKAHDNVWKKRGSLAKRVQNVLREAETDVAAVIESTDDEQTPPAFGVKSTPIFSVASRRQEVV